MTMANLDQHKTKLPCTDGFDRLRSVGLWTAPTSGRVVLVAPPAETALLTPAQARALSTRLDELATVVEAQHADLVRVSRDRVAQRRSGVA
ncbi:hypothetical protein [Actinokineospora alba]|uniref:hypothetical protein n=1 Tax=Actinokineospora alba TaxID=504798 RepID=UPI000B834151|nr:hypothetical protein [Actinokineospora alba]